MPAVPPAPSRSLPDPPPGLSAVGWDDGHAASFVTQLGAHVDAGRGPSAADAVLFPGRVTRVDRGACTVLTAAGPQRASPSGAVLAAAASDPSSTPCVGDWTVLRRWPDGPVTLEAVLPRRTAIVRAAVAPGTSQAQVLAANVDVAVIVEGLQPDPDLGRVERLLTLAWESGAQPLVVLTKADLLADAEPLCEEVAAVAPGVEVIALSAVSGAGVGRLAGHAAPDGPRGRPGRTLVLLGPSGAGKSTLVNALVGMEVMRVRGLRSDGKGRHTTVHRELLVLPDGGLVVDTPGLRSVGLTALDDSDDGSLGKVFDDVEGLAASCRFADCGHVAEPGCAVRAALDRGALSERRLESWRKLQREARWMAMRHDARLRAVERARWKRLGAEVRRSGRVRP